MTGARGKESEIPPEGQRVEWKISLGEWKEIVETCAAFATTQENGHVTKQEYMRLTSATEVTAKRDLADLVGKGILVRRGATRNIRYELAGSVDPLNDPKETRK